MEISFVLSLSLITMFGFTNIYAQVGEKVVLAPTVLPNATYCETTALRLNETSFEFRWTLKGLQEYFETVRKFYDTVYFTKRIPESERDQGLAIFVKVGVTARSLTATVEMSPSRAKSNEGSSFEGQLSIKSRHGLASFSSTQVTQLPESLEFKWYLAQTEREEVGRLLEIYTDAVIANRPRASLILPNGNKNTQAVTLGFKIIQYGISPILTIGGGGGLKRCSGKELN